MMKGGTRKGELKKGIYLQLVTALPCGYRDNSICRGFVEGHLKTARLWRHLQLRCGDGCCRGKRRLTCRPSPRRLRVFSLSLRLNGELVSVQADS